MIGYVISGIALLLLIIAIIYFNRMVAYKNRLKNAWSDIDVQLKRRSSLIPMLVESVKGYATHEKKLFEDVTQLRSEASQTSNLQQREKIENSMKSAINAIMVLVENYPELKAAANFLQLQQQLVEVEDTLQNARRYYNAIVRDNNTLIQSFPSNLFASIFGYKTAEFFQADATEKDNVQVKTN